MKYKVLVLDDSRDDLNRIRSYLTEFWRRNLICFYDQKLSSDIQFSDYDLYILDIDFGDDLEKGGFLAARRIQKENPSASVIFCTDHDELVYESFRFDTLYFVRKENMNEELGHAIQKYICRQTNADAVYKLRKGGSVQLIAYKKICCITAMGNSSSFSLINGEIQFEDRLLGKIANDLPGELFFRVSRQAVVNLQNIEMIRDGEIWLSNHQHLKIPHGKIKDLKKAVLKSV